MSAYRLLFQNCNENITGRQNSSLQLTKSEKDA
ncbi:hypothetical protein NSE_0722 [Neorickettsia sennetsu str. Miyayama]|uniref:Uncharacterized protein n=1 Tax=Ehrlichia sennetsu (strain ATCC VR-367 / Miyayama) TaxID=222891 RepID=Q2GD48_EHRS3|nr:hypothetical protein NSE_0722 [Neorickettsia sennetsu str. Miyayama]